MTVSIFFYKVPNHEILWWHLASSKWSPFRIALSGAIVWKNLFKLTVSSERQQFYEPTKPLHPQWLFCFAGTRYTDAVEQFEPAIVWLSSVCNVVDDKMDAVLKEIPTDFDLAHFSRSKCFFLFEWLFKAGRVGVHTMMNKPSFTNRQLKQPCTSHLFWYSFHDLTLMTSTCNLVLMISTCNPLR